MAVQRRMRQSERPAGSASSVSHRRSASGNENSCVSASVIHLRAVRWRSGGGGVAQAGREAAQIQYS